MMGAWTATPFDRRARPERTDARGTARRWSSPRTRRTHDRAAAGAWGCGSRPPAARPPPARRAPRPRDVQRGPYSRRPSYC